MNDFIHSSGVNTGTERKPGDENKIEIAEGDAAIKAKQRQKELEAAMAKGRNHRDAVKKFSNRLIVLIVMVCVGYAGYIHLMSKKTIQQQAAVLNAKNAELRITKNEVDKLESKLAQIKTSEGLAARDLEAYILSKYKTVPRVLAKEIAMKAAKLTKEYSVPFSLIAGLIEVESGFKPWLTSPKGARGLMQVMPEWVKKRKDGGNKLGIAIEDESDMHDVEPNLRAGILVFKIHLREQNNNINSALFKYVGGDRSYANKVFSAMGRFVTFRSTLDTSLKDEDSEEDNKSEPEEIEGTKQLILTPPLGLKQIKSKLC